MIRIKTWEALQVLEQYILQQRKTNVVIYTNDEHTKQLLERAHPKITVELIKLPEPTKTRMGAKLFLDDFDHLNPMIFKPHYRLDDSEKLKIKGGTQYNTPKYWGLYDTKEISSLVHKECADREAK